MCSLCRLPIAKNHNFGQILTFGGLLYRAPLLIRAKFGVLLQTHGICLHAKFHLGRFTLSPSVFENPQFLPFFGLRHLVLSPNGNSPTKLNTGAQLQTFPYPTVSKSFLYSNAFRQTDRQTDKKLNFFGRPGGG